METDIQKRTFQFSLRIIKLCDALDKQPGVSRTLANQLLRSGTSIGANTEEAQAGQSRKDFVAKLSIACKEARESHYWLRLLMESGIVPENKIAALIAENNELIAILTSIIINTRKNSE